MNVPIDQNQTHPPNASTAMFDSPRVSREDVERVRTFGERVATNVSHVLVGKPDVIELALVALLCEGHVLIEDVPGTGKTTLARAIARSMGGAFRRIQFTPDLLPSDISGIVYFDQKQADFRFRAGPIFANVVLADEINRATPRTQSALLEAMEERTVTVEGETRDLPRPFLVLATQNPVELEGTFPLPEAQLDRFLLRLAIGYPNHDEEDAILARFQLSTPLDTLTAVASLEDLIVATNAARRVYVNNDLRHYVTALTRATRDHPATALGASPRASLALFHAAQARAALQGRETVLPDDIQALAPAVIAHRVIVGPEARLRGDDALTVIHEVLRSTPVPVEGNPEGEPGSPQGSRAAVGSHATAR